MEENDDQTRFFADLAATAEQGVEQVRGIEENYYAAVHWAILPSYALELSQAKDF